MLVFTRVVKLAAILVAMSLGVPTLSRAQTTGVVRLHIVKAGFLIGVGSGSGVLTYRGESYSLAVSGVGIGSLGVATVELVGSASNLISPASIAGKVLTFHPRAWLSFAPPPCRMPLGQSQGIPQADPRGLATPWF